MSYQRKQAFVVPSWQTRDAPATQVSLDPPNEEWRDKAYTLHAAKKRATTSFSRVANQPKDYRAQEAWAEEERAVLRARAGLLDTLMGGHEDPKLCLPAQQSPNRVCVTYNRVRCEADGQVLLGPMQSTLSWVVHGGEAAMQGLSDGPSSLGLLLGAIRRSMPPGKEALKALDRALRLPLPDRLETKATASPDQTRAMQGGAFHVVWGALDLDVQEPWQNPSTNAAIRKSILQTAHEAMREAVRARKPLWSAANHLTVRIVHDDESHNLTLAPFCDSEACTVTHMQFVQSVFDQSGPERGILNLGQDPEATHAIPLGRITPIEGYVCLKAHRQTRLTEVQLNYVHSRGLLKHKGFDTSLLPAPEGLFLGKGLGGNSMPPTKSTRLSGTGVDVLASSYHLADQVYTTITVVRYPPFGTQFSKVLSVKSNAPPRLSAGDNEIEPDDESKSEQGSDEDGSGSDDFDVVIDEKWNAGEREALDEDDKLLYKEERRRWIVRKNKTGRLTHKPKRWEMPLNVGQFYFIDGFYGDPYKPDGRFVLFEVDNGNVYKDAQAKAIEIRDEMIKQFGDQWIPSLSFYDNIKKNQKIKDMWRSSWADFLYFHVSTLRQEHEAEMSRRKDSFDLPQHTFWHTDNMNNWVRVFKRDMTADDSKRLLNKTKIEEKYNPNSVFGRKMLFQIEKASTWIKHWTELGYLDSKAVDNALCKFRPSSFNGRASAKTKMIPIPRALPAPPAKATQEAVRTLQSRICALETKLEKANNNRNTQALLEKVLERLEETD
jgi:hypothetical protein